MYTSWAEKHGCTTKIIERYQSKGSTTEIAVVEYESEYMYGYLSGERGVHQKICSSLDGSAVPKVIIHSTWFGIYYKSLLFCYK